jgi:hypothetical protein
VTRFARHLAAALLAVAAVVALGVALEHSDVAARFIGVPAGALNFQREVRLSNPGQGAVFIGKPPPGKGPPPGGAPGRPVVTGRQIIDGGAPLTLANTSNLIHTALLEALIIAVVAVLTVESRRHRRNRRLLASQDDDS